MSSYSRIHNFFEYVRKKGIASSNTVTGWSSAFTTVEKVLDESEKDLDFILNNTDIIKNRLQNQNDNISGGTLNIYIQRSTRAIAAFREWEQDRAAWEKKMASSAVTRPSTSAQGKTTSSSKVVNASKDISIEIPEQKSKKVFPIPTSSGDSFDVALPKSYKMSDLPRVIWALAVYAEDFDPSEVLRRYGTPPVNESVTNKMTAVQ